MLYCYYYEFNEETDYIHSPAVLAISIALSGCQPVKTTATTGATIASGKSSARAAPVRHRPADAGSATSGMPAH